MLGIFLAASVWHFGEGDVAAQPAYFGAMEILARGGLPIFVPIVHKPGSVARIFELLCGAEGLPTLMTCCRVASLVHLAATIMTLVRHGKRLHFDRHAVPFFEILVLYALFSTVRPILAFAIYFNLYHSVRHIIRVGYVTPELSIKGMKMAVP